VTGVLDAASAQGLAIKVEDLRKTYGETVAVDGVSFSVREHEIFGILGPNGAGKTTTVEILEGLRKADSGTAIVAGVDVGRHPARVKSLIGVQLQASSFFDNLRLTELIDLFAAIYGRKVDALALLTKVDLREKARAYTKHLSGGQKQRFSIATALVNEPRVIFLDEPTTGLDPQARRNLWELVQTLREEGATVVLTTHYMDEAETLCDRVAIMDEGRIVTLDTPGALVERLIDKGFRRKKREREANLEDVFIDLTGKDLREG
jgi:ABC-2 type transport system ATP-binding protein